MFLLMFFGLGSLVALRQLAPETSPILELVAMLLPVINRYLTEAVKRRDPELAERLGGRTLARNVGFVLFLVFALTGLAVRPEFFIPAAPASLTAVDWVEWVIGILAAVVTVLYWTIRGSNDVHDKLDPPAPPPDEPPTPPARAGYTPKFS